VRIGALDWAPARSNRRVNKPGIIKYANSYPQDIPQERGVAGSKRMPNRSEIDLGRICAS
jgi:NADH-quinone oxidoreductase subunit A